MTDSFDLHADVAAGEGAGEDFTAQTSGAAEAAAAASQAAARVQLAQAVVDVPLPQPGQTVVVQAAPGTTLRFLFDPSDARSSQEDGNLVLAVNGGEVVIEGWESATSGEIPVEITNTDGAVINIADFLLALGISPEAGTEPAAGGEPAGPLPGTVPNAGAGFTPGQGPSILGGIDPEGPVDPTALQYRVPEREPRRFELEEDDGPDARDDGPGTDNDAACLDEADLIIDGGEGGHEFEAGGAIVTGTQAGVAPVEGAHQFFLTADAGFSVDAINAFFGLPGNTIQNLPFVDDPYEGGAMKTEVTVEAGDTLTFSFNFLEDDYDPYIDFAVVVIGDQVFKLADLLEATNPGPNGTAISHEGQTGYLTFNHIFAVGGTYQIGFAVMNDEDGVGDPGLLIDKVVISGAGGDKFVDGFENGAGNWEVLGGVGNVGGATTISDNVLDNDSTGPDTPISIVGITYVGGIGDADAPDLSQPGKVTITAADGSWVLEFYTSDANGDGRAMGDYTFTLLGPIDHPLPGLDDLHGAFQYTIADADGDTDSATLTICIKDDVPSVLLEGGEGGLTLDESVGYDFGYGNPGLFLFGDEDDELDSADPDDIGYATAHVFDLFFGDYDFGADGAGDITYGLTLSQQEADSGLVDTKSGTPVLLSQLPNGDIVGLNGNGQEVLRIVMEGDGQIRVHQYRAVEHDDPTDDDEAGSPESIAPGLVGVSLTVTDGDGDSATATAELGALIEFEDDGPQLFVSGAEGGVTLDETDGDADDDVLGGLLASKSIDIADLAAVSVDFDSDGPADGGGLTYALEIGNPDTGLTDTASGDPILLTFDGTDVVGRAGAGGPEVFRISIDAETNEITITQSRAIVHPNTGDHDDDVSIGFDTIGLKITATDGDGDSVSDTIDLGSRITFEDDGPAISLTGSTATARLDESVGADLADPNADDETNPAATPGAIGFATLSGAAFFTVNPGSDGEASRAYELTLSAAGADSGLTDTDSGNGVFLFLIGGQIVGREGTDATDALNNGDDVFTVAIDATTGEVTVNQFRAIEHNDPADPDESGAGEPETIAANLIGVKLTVTDGDGDTATASVDIGPKIEFEDDGPILEIGGAEGAIVLDETDNDGDDGDVGGLLASASVHFTTLFPSVAADFGSDKEGAVPAAGVLTLAAGSSGLVDAKTDEAVVLVQLDPFTIVGRTEDGGLEVFRITLDGVTGLITVTQSRAVEHDDPEDHDEADSPESIAAGLVGIEVTITDGDGDTATDSVDLGQLIRFEDDGPSVSLAPSTQGVFLTLDESVGTDAGDANAHDETNPAAALGAIGFATAQASALFDETVAFGSDGPAAGGGKAYELVLTGGNGTASGIVDTESGDPVLLSLEGGVIVGRADGETVFTIEIDADTGQVTVNQFRAVRHDDPNDHDESTSPESIAAGLVGVKLTVTDGDGDTAASTTIDIGPKIRFEDDGPKVALALADGAEIRVDETADDGDENGSGLLANVTVSGVTLFNGAVDAGSDGEFARGYLLSLNGGNGVDSGLDDTRSGENVLLYNVSGEIVGRTAVGNLEVFRISINQETGDVTVAQSRAVVHGDPTDPDEADTPKSINPNLVEVSLVAFDGDGDGAGQTVDLGPVIKFEDDGPVFDAGDADIGNVAEGDPLPDVTSGSIGVDFGSDGPGDVTNISLTTPLTSGGVAIVPTFDPNTNTLTGKAGAETIFTLTIDPATGEYTFDLLGAIDHDGGASKALGFGFTVTDGDGDPITGNLTVNVTDDGPSPADDNVTVGDAGDTVTNLLIVLDRSGSMDEDPGVAGFAERIDLARAALVQLMNSYETFGPVNIRIVSFAGGATSNPGGWLTGPDAIQKAIDYLDSLDTDGNTDYAAAVQQAQAAYAGAPAADQAFVYFLSDGNPTEGGVGGPTFALTDPQRTAWETFVETNFDKAFAVGIGQGVTNEALQDIAFPDGDAQNPIIVTNEEDLLQTLVETIGGSGTGNVLTNDTDFGADGPDGTPYVKSIVIDGETYEYDPATGNVTKNGALVGNTTITDVPTEHGKLTFNFATGAFTFQADNVTDTVPETFTYTVIDGDGTEASAELTVTINDVDTSTIARDDRIRTNVAPGGTLFIPAAALLFNDFHFDGNGLVIGSVDADDAAGTVSLVGGDVQFVQSSDPASFVYTAEAGGSSDDATVTVDSVGVGTLSGTANAEILIGRDDADDTINGLAGSDVLVGNGGNDTLNGGAGADMLLGGAGADVLNGSDGNDYLDGGEDTDADVLNGGDDNDTIIVRTNDIANGGEGADIIILKDNVNFGDIDGGTAQVPAVVPDAPGGYDGANLALHRGDVLVFDGQLDLTAIANGRIQGIETISMQEGDGSVGTAIDELTLSAADVIDIGTGAFDPTGAGQFGSRHAIRVDGDAGDELNLTGDGVWTQISPSDAPAGYNVWVHSTTGTPSESEDAYVLVSTSVTVNAS